MEVPLTVTQTGGQYQQRLGDLDLQPGRQQFRLPGGGRDPDADLHGHRRRRPWRRRHPADHRHHHRHQRCPGDRRRPSNAFTELSPLITGSATPDTVSGTISFTDVDLTDRPVASAAFTSFSLYRRRRQAADAERAAADDVAAVEVAAVGGARPGQYQQRLGHLDLQPGRQQLDFLAAGEILTLTYTATVDDGHGGVVTSRSPSPSPAPTMPRWSTADQQRASPSCLRSAPAARRRIRCPARSASPMST